MVEPIQGEKGVISPPEGKNIVICRLFKKCKKIVVKAQCVADL